jgi:hypothetical protein
VFLSSLFDRLFPANLWQDYNVQTDTNPICWESHFRNDPNYLQIARRLFYSEAETLEKLGNHHQIPRSLADFEED